MTGENWVLVAVIAAWTLIQLARLGVRHSAARRRDQAKAGGQPL